MVKRKKFINMDNLKTPKEILKIATNQDFGS